MNARERMSLDLERVRKTVFPEMQIFLRVNFKIRDTARTKPRSEYHSAYILFTVDDSSDLEELFCQKPRRELLQKLYK